MLEVDVESPFRPQELVWPRARRIGERADRFRLTGGEWPNSLRLRQDCVSPDMKDWAQEILGEREILWESKGKEAIAPKDVSTIKEQQNEYYGNGQAE